MRKIVFLFILVLTVLSIAACEKDDICVDGDTPLLVIRFYNLADTSALKTVTTLSVRGLHPESGLLEVIPNASLDSIALPLRVGENTSTFYISRNLTPTDTTAVNIDTLTFNYETREVFISRACGFVANYGNLSSTLETSAGNWIGSVEIIDTLVANSTATHVKIFH
jgi:hypothetical protein